jgi:hypothetical protein
VGEVDGVEKLDLREVRELVVGQDGAGKSVRPARLAQAAHLVREVCKDIVGKVDGLVGLVGLVKLGGLERVDGLVGQDGLDGGLVLKEILERVAGLDGLD